MKKLLLMLMAGGISASTFAQAPGTKNYSRDADLSRWVIDLNLLGGLASQEFTTANTAGNYNNGVNMTTGQLKSKDGYSFGGDAQLGFFFGNNRHFGLGTGIMFMSQHGKASLDNYHVEYQDKDGAGNTYRQIVNGNVSEDIRYSILNIPVVLKYKNRFSKHWGFTADAGALINLQVHNKYTTNSSFDYEAVYKFQQNSDGGTTSVYDNASTPSANDWLITKAEFLRNNPNGNLQDYFSKKRALGYNVGEGVTPDTHTGHTSYKNASVGLLLQPSLNYFLSDNVALNFGLYYMFQPFKNDPENDYHLTNGMGTYSSVLNSVSASNDQQYGINIGARFFLGKKHAPMYITSIDRIEPTQCGLCDGGMNIHGLTPDKQVTVDYSVNGAKPTRYSGTVQSDGQVKIANLCAGNYSGIVAKEKKRSADGKPLTLDAQVMAMSAQKTTNITAAGACNGSVEFDGMYAGTSVTANYNLNGNAQASFTSVVKPDGSLTISGLCEGKYTGMILTANTCTKSGADFTLAAPIVVVAPVPEPVEVIEKTEITSTVLFDFDKSVIKRSYYPMLNQAIKEMKDDEYILIRVDGHTDIKGTENYNQKLSERRARAVKKYFTERGISSDRVRMYGHSKDQPVASNETAEGRSLNRRVIIITTKK
jgi:outer membrane protein OmpA-like peptidoglycan-associated protein